MWWQVDQADGDIHVTPIDDLVPHALDRSCWCKPEEGDSEEIVIHHSMDGREKYESGEMLPH